MIRIRSILIKGFKDPDAEKELTFSDEQVSVIYGENGSGKTTLLKILFAILSKNEKVLINENVREVIITYSKDKESKKHIVKVKESEVIWDKNQDLYETSSILFGIHRGVNQQRVQEESINRNSVIRKLEDLLNETSRMRSRSSVNSEILALLRKTSDVSRKISPQDFMPIYHELTRVSEFKRNEAIAYMRNELMVEFQTRVISKTYQNERNNLINKLFNESHLLTDFVKIKDIQSAIIYQYNKGQRTVSDKIKNAFFETIEKAVEIDETNEDFHLPVDFNQRIEQNKDFILRAITKEDSSLADRIKNYVERKDKKLTDKSKIFRAMLLNIIESAEEPNPTLESITKLINIFNEHLYNKKKLIVDHEKAFIQLKNGKIHEISELSSGERNLLSILTLFLIIGSTRDFLMIDEPEISFNIKWQRDFLPLLSRLNSSSQIIVASHSPSISQNNSRYLVELL